MDSVQASEWHRDFRLAQADVEAGVSTGRAAAANTHWNKWLDYALALAINPFLETVTDKVPILQVFGRRVRMGILSASTRPVKSRQVEEYLRTVGQTFVSMGKADPRLSLQGAKN